MAVDTTQRITVELENATAQALWAAMHEDDDLASDYANFAVIHALNHYCDQGMMEHLPPNLIYKLFSNLRTARAVAALREDEMVKRWKQYTEPPF